MTEGHTERLESALAGRYRIERKLGEGGMASVYLAEDLKHERKVALKILRPELAAVIGAERFLSEIKTTANLQHPHILPLFDSGEAGGYLYYVMPYIDGETLRDKLDREKQLGVQESLRIAKDVADALDYAHRAGVIHRDIKPGNILLHDGRPVVADFGIALAVSAAGGGRMTETGLSLGTPHYMSPEQASADRDLNARSDVYSLGCVLYEMLGGQPPHTGPSAQSILVHILTEDPKPLTALRHTVPPNVAAAVAKSIEKLPADRFESAREFRTALEDSAFEYTTVQRAAGTARHTVVSETTDSTWHRNRKLTLTGTSVGAAFFFAVLAAWGWLRPVPEPANLSPVRFAFPTSIDFVANTPDLAISPDGQFVVYKVPNEMGTEPLLEVRAMDEPDGTPLRGAAGGEGPFVSPDGQWVGFIHYQGRNRIQRVSILGGSPVTLAQAPTEILGAAWGSDGRIIFGTAGGPLFSVTEGGGEPVQLTSLDPDAGQSTHSWPSIIDGHGAVLFTVSPTGTAPAIGGELAVVELGSGEVTLLGIQGFAPRYTPTGHVLYAVEDGSVRAVPFDVESLEVTGTVVPLLEGVAVKPSGAADFDVSRDGRLVYVQGEGIASQQRSLVWVDREGREEPVTGTPPRAYVYPRLSPDGRRLALDVRDASAGQVLIWDFGAETLTLMTLGEGSFGYPVWMAGGTRVAYATASGDLYSKASNNTGTPQLLLEDPRSPGSDNPNLYFFAQDGTAVVYRDQAHPETNDDLVMYSLDGDSVSWRLNGDFVERNAELSPDGRWMAYSSNESGQPEIYVRPFPDVHSDRRQVSNAGGTSPLWSRDGRELFYIDWRSPARLVSVAIDAVGPDEAFSFGARELLMEWPYYDGAEGRSYDVSLDGQRFIAIRIRDVAARATQVDVHVVLNWFEELRERMGSD